MRATMSGRSTLLGAFRPYRQTNDLGNLGYYSPEPGGATPLLLRNREKEKEMVNKRWFRPSVGGFVLLLVASGCGIFETEQGEPEEVTFILDQSDAPTLETSISLNFLVSENNSLSFEDLTVDTVSVPFQQTYDISRLLRFYVLVTNVEPEVANFHMRVSIDQKKWYDEDKSLEPGETAQFVYRFQAPVIY